MPKKFKGENSKAVEARARKSAQKEAEDERKQKQLEDEYWKEDDKLVLKKQQRKEDREKKKTEQLERKKENQKLAEDELLSIKSAKPAATSSQKVTRAAVEVHVATLAAADAAQANTQQSETVTEQPLEENVNRLQFEGEEARTVDEAIKVLSVDDTASSVDMHPEKRVKAAYLAFEEKNMPRLKNEYPNLRLSQLKQILKKEWVRSPENPLNQRLLNQAQ